MDGGAWDAAARLAEAERIVHEAAREKELRQEEAMLCGGGKAAAESASEERNVGQGNATDAGGVEAKIETVRPAAEGRFDWKQGDERIPLIKLLFCSTLVKMRQCVNVLQTSTNMSRQIGIVFMLKLRRANDTKVSIRMLLKK